MVTLYVHLREQIAKRLNHGLSETILVNTLTDVREFKNINDLINAQSLCWAILIPFFLGGGGEKERSLICKLYLSVFN